MKNTETSKQPAASDLSVSAGYHLYRVAKEVPDIKCEAVFAQMDEKHETICKATVTRNRKFFDNNRNNHD